jgi:acyl-CoA reductase-like NAD-dependent aldehyde dehydrogenase
MTDAKADVGQGGAIQAAIERARLAQSAWARLSWPARARALRGLAGRLARDSELERLVSAETGKPLFEAVGFEIAYVCEAIRYFTGRAGRRALGESRRFSLILPHKRSRVAWQPRGIVAVIGPWNFPLLNNFGDAIAPLVAGNAVLLKPSPHTPLTSRRVEALWREEGLPENVFQVVEGGAEAGRALLDACDMVFFTGSLAVGRQVASRAGERLIPCIAELGGKSAMIVLSDADLLPAARAAVWGAFAGAGQVCIRVERVLVEAAVADEFAGLVAEETKKLRLGRQGDVDVGPLLVEGQIERCRALVTDAVARGARLLAGGDARQDSFFTPTVLDRVSPKAAVACEETFGPVLPILRVRDADEAVRLTNESHLGLSGAVWSRDRAHARAIARRLRTGSVCINDVLVNYFCVGAPLGAANQGGLGFRHGPESLRQFCYPQTIVEDRLFSRPLAGWIRKQIGFPYRQRVLDVLRWLLRALYR